MILILLNNVESARITVRLSWYSVICSGTFCMFVSFFICCINCTEASKLSEWTIRELDRARSEFD